MEALTSPLYLQYAIVADLFRRQACANSTGLGLHGDVDLKPQACDHGRAPVPVLRPNRSVVSKIFTAL
jgi:hypothetical protein